jgi:hemolysin activation/secretion protein
MAFSRIQLSAQELNDTTKNRSLAAIPILNYSNTLGAGIGLMGQMFYKVNKNDTISPSSSTGIVGIYYTNNSYLGMAFQRLYLKEDRWRLMLAAGLGNFNYQYWQEIGQNYGTFIDFSTGAPFAMARIERQVYNRLYFGVEGTYSEAETDFDLPDFFPDELKNQRINLSNVGYLFNFDKREHQSNPYGGYNFEFKNNFYRSWIGSGADFESFKITYNHYYKIKNERNILATRVKATIATGDVPFQGQSVVGQDDIRGYSNGRYRGDQVYAMQAEYRWRFYKKFGMVGFAGVASAVENLNDIFDEELLPGSGVGIRYMMLPKERINIGIDVAKGKDDWGLYFRIGESFGR